MDNDQIIDMDCNVQKFCVSYVCCHIAAYGIQTVVDSWNSHTIPGKFLISVEHLAQNFRFT